MRPMNKHYACVTGFNSTDELDAIDSTRIVGMDIFLGVLVSSKSFKGERSSPRHALVDELDQMVTHHSKRHSDWPTKMVAHFNVNKGFESFAPENVKILAEMVGAVQLNIADPFILEEIMAKIGGIDATVIFQLNKTMSTRLGEGSVQYYKDIWDKSTSDHSYDLKNRQTHMLFDMSGGRGQLLDWDKARRFVETCNVYKQFVPAVAGGLTPENVMQAVNLGASVDIETNVRTPEDKLDVAKSNLFFNNIREGMRS